MLPSYSKTCVATLKKTENWLSKCFKPSAKTFLLTVLKRYFFCGSFVLFMSCVCHAFASVHCCLVVTWREKGWPLGFCLWCLLWFCYSWESYGTWLYRFLILAVFLTFFKTNYLLMQVKSIAECSKGSILQYFWPSLSYHLSIRSLFCQFLGGPFIQVFTV